MDIEIKKEKIASEEHLVEMFQKLHSARYRNGGCSFIFRNSKIIGTMRLHWKDIFQSPSIFREFW